MQPDQALEAIQRQPKGRSSFKTLVKVLRVKGAEREALQTTLDSLVQDGRLVEARRGHYRLPEPGRGMIAGRFTQNRAGYGFVTPDRPIPGVDGDVYIGHDVAADAMQGDRVLIKIERKGEDGRASGRIRRILYRAQSLVVGAFHYSRRGCWVEPHDDRVRGDIEILPGKELPPPEAMGERLGGVEPPRVETPEDLHGMIVTVAVTEFPSRLHPARGKVVEVLGDVDDFGVDVEVTIRKHHIPYRFPEEAIEESEAILEEIPEEALVGRRDFRDLPIVTIDGETARDFDDAVYVERIGGGYALQVHIADVSHYVRPGSEIDREARRRGTSAYFPDRAVPMLPGRLSTGVCSLNPNVDRLVMSALLEIDKRGEITGAEFCRGVIRSSARMTYTKVFAILEGDEALRKEYATVVEGFELMQELAEILIRKRRNRGAIDLDLPEPVIELDDRGRMTGVRRAERNIAHRLIEEFMLAANEAVDTRITRAERPSLHRVHEQPSAKSVLEFEETARAFGRALGVEAGARVFERSRRRRDGSKPLKTVRVAGAAPVEPRDYQKFIESIKGSPEERILSYRLLRSLKQARYSEEPKGHFALAADLYTHFTSPIRRYPDLIVHRILGDLLEAGPASPYGGENGPFELDELAALADETSLAERRAAAAERELLDWKRAKFMEQRMGDEFDAVIVAASASGAWVELDELFVEGFIPIESFSGERFFYKDNLRALVASSSKGKLGLGDRVRVRCDRIAWDRLKPEFSYLGPARGGPSKHGDV